MEGETDRKTDKVVNVRFCLSASTDHRTWTRLKDNLGAPWCENKILTSPRINLDHVSYVEFEEGL